jgi:PA14 domain
VLADRAVVSRSRWLFALSASLMLAAFLVKIACAPALCTIALYSLVALRRRPADVVKRHSFFYVTLLLGLFAVCLVYYFKKGDLFWQFKAEAFYYETYKPAGYLAGFINYANLLWEYPRSLFWLSGYPSFRYFDHGLLFWLVVPAAIVAVRRGNDWLRLLLATIAIVFVFFEFYPQYLSPRYLPLVRQERYLEMLVPAATIIAGWALYALSRRHRIVAATALALLLSDSVIEASRRFTEYDDSQQDMRELARYASATIARADGRLVVDLPAKNALSFYLRDVPVETAQFQSIQQSDLRQCYVAVGGARSFWWSRTEIADVDPATVPPHWILTYEAPGRMRPWRSSRLRVYYISEPPKDWYALLDSPIADHLESASAGLTRSSFAGGFEGEPLAVDRNQPIGDIDNTTQLAASHLQWAGWMHANDAVYTFETKSDDGSWIYLNDKLILDNGGTHPAKVMRRSVRLAQGWYRFRFRYEDAGGDRFLQFRVYKDYVPAALPQADMFFSQPEGSSAPAASPSKARG